MTATKKPPLFPRMVRARMVRALRDSPVVLVHGPRQCGKTTLSREVGDELGYAYISFDDDVQRASAQADPVGFVRGLRPKVVLDEVQRVPELFTSIKSAIDRNRRAGRFILTGSANVLLLPKLSDSLAGRMEIIRLHPLSQAELNSHNSTFLDALFDKRFKASTKPALGATIAEIIVSGGYPAALARKSRARRQAWYRDYVETLVQRDVRDIARISANDVMARLLASAATQTAHLLNISDLAAPFQVSRPTIREYITLLERIFFLEELPPWHVNRLSRLIKAPKLHLNDTGIACSLLGVDAKALIADRSLYGQMLETFVYQELRRQASGYDRPFNFYHFRDKDGLEVDIVIESRLKVAGLEVKAAASVNASDFRGLRKLRDAAGKRFSAGAVLYDGEVLTSFGDGMFAVPVRMLWEAVRTTRSTH